MSLKLKYNISQWNDLGLNYWGIPKCMNTAIKLALFQKCGKFDDVQIDPYDIGVDYHKEKLISYIDPKTALNNNNINFTVIRHPYERSISLYKDFSLRRKDGSIEQHKNIDQFIAYLGTTNDQQNIHLRSQCYFICDNDRIHSTMNVHDERTIHDFLRPLGIKIQVINKTQELNITLTEKQKQIIQKRYRKDFDVLGFNA